jgi:hypothetical protein
MIQRFFFDRVKAKTTGFAIDLSDQLPAFILPDTANPALSFGQHTHVRTKSAFNFFVLKLNRIGSGIH